MERTREHIRCLDHLRGLAVLAVFLFHCLWAAYGYGQLPWGPFFRSFAVPGPFAALIPVTYLGEAGVAIFFVISGICIHLSYLRGTPGDWRSFFIRRFFRIYPPYLVALILVAWTIPMWPLRWNAISGWADLGFHVFLIHNFVRKFTFDINASLWSVAVEVQLYLIYPALIALVRKLDWGRTLLLLGGMEVLLRAYIGLKTAQYIHISPGWVDLTPFFFWFSWAIGAYVADAFAKGKQSLPFQSQSLAVWSFLAIGAFLVKCLAIFTFLCFAVLTAIVVARYLASGGTLPLPRLVLSHLHWLGVYSYSFYLLHAPILFALTRWLNATRLSNFPLAVFAICMATYPLVFGLSWVFYRCCEQNSIALGKLFLRRKLKMEGEIAAAN